MCIRPDFQKLSIISKLTVTKWRLTWRRFCSSSDAMAWSGWTQCTKNYAEN